MTFEKDQRPPFIGYGYWWWILPPDPADESRTEIYTASGFRGQYIMVLPAQDMVVVVTGGTRRYATSRNRSNLCTATFYRQPTALSEHGEVPTIA